MSFFQTGEIVWDSIVADITGRNDVNALVNDLMPQVRSNMFIRLTLKGHGPLDRILRLDRQGFRELVETKTGCECADLVVSTLPEIDLERRRDTGDFISAIIEYGDRISNMDRNDMIDAVCSTGASDAIRDSFEAMSTEELRSLVSDAVLLIIEKSEEGI